MGYMVNVGEQKLAFKKDVDLTAVLRAVKQTMLNPATMDEHAHGFAAGEKQYSWTETAKLRKATSIYDFIRQFVDDLSLDDENDVYTFRIEFNSNAGDEEFLFETLAPFIEAGSYIVWTGEGGEHWRWEFDGTKMKTVTGRVVYDE